MSLLEAEAPPGESVTTELMEDLLRYFIRRLDDRDDAADALGETLLTLWRRRNKTPADPEGARKWAFGVARGVLANARRGRIKRSSATVELSEAIEVGTPFTEPDLDLRNALATLHDDDRELVLLVAWDGFGVAEAGAVLGLKPDAARARYSRARAKLRLALA